MTTQWLRVQVAVAALAFAGVSWAQGTAATASHVNLLPGRSARRQLFPGVARADGVNQTRWRTQVLLLNTASDGQGAELRVIPRDGATPAQECYLASLEPGGMQVVPDLYEALGIAGGAGALQLDGQVASWVRTYNQGSEGSFGQDVPGFEAETYFEAGERVAFPVFTPASLAGDSRTNLLLQSLDTQDIVLTALTPTTQRSWSLRAGVNTNLGSFGAWAGASPGVVPVVVSGTGKWNGYVSVIDPVTGDPTTFRGQRPASFLTREYPGVASAAGVGGARWRTEVVLCNLSGSAVQVRLELIPRCQTPPACTTAPVASSVLEVAAGEALRLPDLYVALGAGEGVATLRVTGEILAWVRTYNQGAIGTFGQDVPELPEDAAHLPGERVHFPVHTRPSSIAAEPRSNLLLLSMDSAEQTVSYSVGGATGTVVLPAHAFVQRPAVGEAIGAAPGDGALEVTSTGRWNGTVSTVEAGTGDPTTFRGIKALQSLDVTCVGGPSSGVVPLETAFRCDVRGGLWPFEYAWTFGDGLSSTLAAPSHTYTAAGTWAWSVTVTDAGHRQATGGGSVSLTEPCSYAIVPTSASFPASGGSGSVAVTAGAGCSWTAASRVPWITIASGSSGSGSGTVAYIVAANTGPERQGALNIAGETFAVAQVAGCAYAIVPTSASFPASGGSGSVAVTAGAGCPWTAASRVPWITVASGSSGSGSGTVAYIVAANTGSAREGSLAVAAQTVRVLQEAPSAPDEITITLPGGVPLALVRVPAGTFVMGSPVGERGRDSDEVQHQVTLTRDYYLGRTEVTQQQWKAVMGINPSGDCGDFGLGDDNPVYCVAWTAIAGVDGFIDRVNRLLGTTAFRLPTEAEWERAARGGTTWPFSFGDDLGCDAYSCGMCPHFDQHMWWCTNSGSKSHPVGLKQANQLGLHDMHGNVWEYVQDYYGDYPTTPEVDPAGPETGSYRAARGGGYERTSKDCRCAERGRGTPYVRYGFVGFRLARSL